MVLCNASVLNNSIKCESHTPKSPPTPGWETLFFSTGVIFKAWLMIVVMAVYVVVFDRLGRIYNENPIFCTFYFFFLGILTMLWCYILTWNLPGLVFSFICACLFNPAHFQSISLFCTQTTSPHSDTWHTTISIKLLGIWSSRRLHQTSSGTFIFTNFSFCIAAPVTNVQKEKVCALLTFSWTALSNLQMFLDMLFLVVLQQTPRLRGIK